MTEEQLLAELRKTWIYRNGGIPEREESETDYDELIGLIERFYVSDLVCEECAEYMLDADKAIEMIYGGYGIETFEQWESAVYDLAKEHGAECAGDEEGEAACEE
jgi:hypothetical protein